MKKNDHHGLIHHPQPSLTKSYSLWLVLIPYSSPLQLLGPKIPWSSPGALLRAATGRSMALGAARIGGAAGGAVLLLVAGLTGMALVSTNQVENLPVMAGLPMKNRDFSRTSTIYSWFTL